MGQQEAALRNQTQQIRDLEAQLGQLQMRCKKNDLRLRQANMVRKDAARDQKQKDALIADLKNKIV